MTASATSSAQSAPANGNQATRQASGSAASSKSQQSSPADLFSSLLGLLSATNDNPLLLGGEGLADASDPEDPNALLISDASAMGNPLADLIGWPGAVAMAPSTPTPSAADVTSVLAQGNALSAGSPEASTGSSGLTLQGMTLLAEPVAADPSLVAGLKNPASASNLTNPSATNAAADRDAVAVSYGTPKEAPSGAEAINPSRSGAYMAARPANWRSTTALPAAGPAAATSGSAPTQTAAIQVAQNAASQRNLIADPLLPGDRNAVAPNERFSDTSLPDAVNAELGAVNAPGQASKGEADTTGNGREGPLLAGSATPDAGDVDAPEEAFSLDAALASEDDLEGTEFMAPQQLRHANVRVGEGTDEAIDIQLSMEGEAVNVAFRTDNAEVRTGLQQNASASLSDLMQRGGVQLGGVSVGAQSQQSGGQPGSSESPSPRVGGSNGRHSSGPRSVDTSGSEAGQRPPVAKRSDGGPALDIFA